MVAEDSVFTVLGYLEKGIQTPVAQGRTTHVDDQVDSDQ